VSCEALNRNLPALTAAGRGELARQAREAVEDLAVFARVLDATRANLKVMGACASCAPSGWSTASGRYRDGGARRAVMGTINSAYALISGALTPIKRL